MKRIAGVTLLETVMASLLVGVVGVSATLGTQFASKRQATARQRQQVSNLIQQELSTLRAQAMRGTLSSALNTTVTRSLSGIKNLTVQTVSTPSNEAANVVNITITVSYNDGQPRTMTFRSAAFNNRLPRIISVKLAPTSVPALSQSRFFGMLPSANWNRVTAGTAAGNSLTDNEGNAVTMGMTSTLGLLQDFTLNLLTTSDDAAGENVSGVFRGAIWNGLLTPPAYTVSLTNVPFARYDVILYVNLPNLGLGGDGSVSLVGGQTLNTALSLNLLDLGRQEYTLGKNTLVFSNITNPNPTFALSGLLIAPPLHGFQVVERI